jgi:predicted porin
MQKKIIALAIAAAFAAPVAAQADSSFYGSMDGGLRHQNNDSSTGAGTTDSMKMGQYNTSRWGFKGVDDLGDGMKANVVVETSFVPTGVGSNSDLNTSANAAAQTTNSPSNNPFGLIFDRQATVGLEGSMGKFDMGWNTTTSYDIIKTYDPMDYKFIAIAKATSSANASREGNLRYSIKTGDVTVMAEYDMNNSYESRQPTSGTGRAVGATYAVGAINAGAVYTTKEEFTPAAGGTGATTHVTAGAGYNYGDGKVSVGYAKKATKVATTSDITATNMWVGANFNMSPKMTVTGAYYLRATNTGGANVDDVKSNTLMAQVVYSMSMKTQLYFEADRSVSNAGGTALDVITTGMSAGLDVKF